MQLIFIFFVIVALGNIYYDVLRRMIGNSMRGIHIDFPLHFKTLLLSQNTHKNISHSNKKSRNPLMGSMLKKTPTLTWMPVCTRDPKMAV